MGYTSNGIGDIEKLLREAAKRWRSEQPQPSEPDPLTLIRRRRLGLLDRLGVRVLQRRRWLPAAAAACAVALMIGVAAGVMVGRERRQSAIPPAVDGSAPLAARVVSEGDRVIGDGWVIAHRRQPLRLCGPALLPQAGPDRPGPMCPPISVELVGVEPSTLPGWTERDGVGFSSQVRIYGLWRGGVLYADRIERPAPETPRPSRRVPCDLPSTWPDKAWGSEEFEAAQRRLDSELREYPERYGGRWVTYPEQASTIGPDFGPYVVVVSTVEDPAATQRRLTDIYPFSLCVVRAEHSAADLNAVVDRLNTDSRTWVASVRRPDLNRVSVDLIVIDQAALARIGDDADKVVVKPLIHKGVAATG